MLRPTVTARHDTKFCPTKYPIYLRGWPMPMVPIRSECLCILPTYLKQTAISLPTTIHGCYIFYKNKRLLCS